jgi:hypothetical protein
MVVPAHQAIWLLACPLAEQWHLQAGHVEGVEGWQKIAVEASYVT